MTTISLGNEKCSVCSQTSSHNTIMSTNTFGSPDLDTRPAEMRRSTMNMWVQTCPSCGYCAVEISEKIDKSSEVVHSDVYQKQLKNTEFPELANAFLCFSIIQESSGEYAGAVWTSIHAAWVCDDAENNTGAQYCRMRAVGLQQKAKEKQQMILELPGAKEAIMVDLLRRSGKFELALKTCDDGLKKKPVEMLSGFFKFQKTLINKSDTACYTIAKALREEE